MRHAVQIRAACRTLSSLPRRHFVKQTEISRNFLRFDDTVLGIGVKLVPCREYVFPKGVHTTCHAYPNTLIYQCRESHSRYCLEVGRPCLKNKSRSPLQCGANGSFSTDGVRFELTEGITFGGFQDRCIKPLCHPSRVQAESGVRGDDSAPPTLWQANSMNAPALIAAGGR